MIPVALFGFAVLAGSKVSAVFLQLVIVLDVAPGRPETTVVVSAIGLAELATSAYWHLSTTFSPGYSLDAAVVSTEESSPLEAEVEFHLLLRSLQS